MPTSASMSPSPMRRRCFAASLAVLLGLTACSGQDGSSDPENVPATVAPSSSGASAPPTGAPAPRPSSSPARSTVLREHAVSAAHPLAVDAGMDVLAAGGNAADAAVATAFAVAVVEPFASGIGGGGSAVLAEQGTDPAAYDYREVVARDGVVPASGTGIPGFVAGMVEIHGEHGELPWAELLEPAIALAQDGFGISPFLANRMSSDAGPAALAPLPQFNAGGDLLGEGDRLVQRDLAATMKVLANEGGEAFYTGSLVDELSAVDGIDAGSLADYKVEKQDPVSGGFGEFQVVSAPPALPGAALIQMLQVAEAMDVATLEPGSADYVERLSEAWKVADAGVVRYFGDPRFVEVPVDRLTDAATNARLAKVAARAAAGPVEPPPAGDGAIAAGNTTHLTVVDSDGLTVSMTNTITNFWGGGGAESVGGFFLNNQLSRFGTLDTPNNQPAPGRKSVSWAAPSLVLDDRGRPVLGLGTPGGHQIPNILAGVLVPWALGGATLQEAVDAPRHHLQDGVVALEEAPSRDLAARLRSKGWRPQVTARKDAVFGSVQALQIDYATGRITAATDTRREAAHRVGSPIGSRPAGPPSP